MLQVDGLLGRLQIDPHPRPPLPDYEFEAGLDARIASEAGKFFTECPARRLDATGSGMLTLGR